MDKTAFPEFFLGANTPSGFSSLYQGFTSPVDDRLFILKGGPGCGKSTLMKTIADACREDGRFVERIRCSGDPDSLDGIYIPSLHTGYVDGTSPHVLEPSYAGSEGVYVNMGAFYDPDVLARNREGIRELTDTYKAHYRRAFRLLGGAAALGEKPILSPALREAAVRRARGFIRRELRGQGEGKTRLRFLTGNTCLGPIGLWDTVPALADKIYVLDNELGLGNVFLDEVMAAAAQRGLEAVACRSPMDPAVTEHLLLPGLGLAVITTSSALPYSGPFTRRLRLDALPDRAELASLKAGLRRRAKARSALMAEATAALREAKEAHDRLEALYIPAVDFAGIDRLTQRHIQALLG